VPRHCCHRKLAPSPVPDSPWKRLSPHNLPVSNGVESILVFVDRMMKMSHSILCLKPTSAPEFSCLFGFYIFKLHCLLNSSVLDHGSIFTYNSWFTFASVPRIDPSKYTVFHAQTFEWRTTCPRILFYQSSSDSLNPTETSITKQLISVCITLPEPSRRQFYQRLQIHLCHSSSIFYKQMVKQNECITLETYLQSLAILNRMNRLNCFLWQCSHIALLTKNPPRHSHSSLTTVCIRFPHRIYFYFDISCCLSRRSIRVLSPRGTRMPCVSHCGIRSSHFQTCPFGNFNLHSLGFYILSLLYLWILSVFYVVCLHFMVFSWVNFQFFGTQCEDQYALRKPRGLRPKRRGYCHGMDIVPYLYPCNQRPTIPLLSLHFFSCPMFEPSTSLFYCSPILHPTGQPHSDRLELKIDRQISPWLALVQFHP